MQRVLDPALLNQSELGFGELVSGFGVKGLGHGLITGEPLHGTNHTKSSLSVKTV